MTAARTGESLTVAMTGASGLVGTRLAAALLARGHAVRGLSRSAGRDAKGEGRTTWRTYDPMDAATIAKAVEGCDAVVHLAGENLFGRRWNAESMAAIRASRVDATRALVAGIGSLGEGRPKTLVSASAVGYYGPLDPAATVDESSPAGNDFLAEVCQGWEREALAAAATGVRVAVARIGVVLAREGGALQKMWMPFSLGLGGPIGGGHQILSWIHVDDLVAMLVAMVEDPRWIGVFNATAPNPVSSRDFARAFGSALRRPAFLPTPGFGLRMMLGKVSSILTTGQRVLPRGAERLGFVWRYPKIDDALNAVVRST